MSRPTAERKRGTTGAGAGAGAVRVTVHTRSCCRVASDPHGATPPRHAWLERDALPPVPLHAYVPPSLGARASRVMAEQHRRQCPRTRRRRWRHPGGAEEHDARLPTIRCDGPGGGGSRPLRAHRVLARRGLLTMRDWHSAHGRGVVGHDVGPSRRTAPVIRQTDGASDRLADGSLQQQWLPPVAGVRRTERFA